MVEEGQIVLFAFPPVDLAAGKLRPALVIRRVPGNHDDWLICMISSQVHQAVSGFDVLMSENDPDFSASGLKVPSVLRLGRLAVVEKEILVGAIGHISRNRLEAIKQTLSTWIQDS
jgi:mRNA interferase MazF